MRQAGTTRPGTRRERGTAAVVMLLLIAIVVGLLAIITLAPGRDALLEVRNDQLREQACLNAVSGCRKMDAAIRREVLPGLQEFLQTAGADPDLDWGLPQLAGLRWPSIRRTFSFSEMPGAGAEDRAEVEARIACEGPPVVLGPAGLRAASKGLQVQDYVFTVYMRSTGHAGLGALKAAQTYEHWGDLCVGLELVPPGTAGLRGGIGFGGAVGSGGVPVTELSGLPEGALSGSSREAAGDSAASREAATGATFTAMTRMPWGPPAGGGAWTGDPEVVSGPVAVGLDNGNKVYAWYLKGLPESASVADARTAVLAFDGWRFDRSYNAGSDDYVPDPGRPTERRWGTPRYAVVVAMAPGAAAWARDTTLLPQAKLILPGGRPFTLTVTVDQDTSWLHEQVQLLDGGGADRNATGEPQFDPGDPFSHGYEIGGQLHPSAQEMGVLARRTTDITVEGYREDLSEHRSGSPLGGAGNQTGTGRTTLVLASVVAKQARLRLSYRGGSAGEIVASSHLLMPAGQSPGDGPVIIVDPGCANCPPPPPRVRFWIVWYHPDGYRHLEPAADERQAE